METIFTCLLLFWTVSIFAYVISTIGTIIEEINSKFQQHKQDLEAINRYMEFKNIS